MKKKIVVVSILLTFVVLVSMSCTAKRSVVATNEDFIEKFAWDIELPEDSTGSVRDAGISSAIKMKFSKDKLISGSNINVDTTDSSVTLNGKVSSQAKADRALYLGRSVDGVKSVQSNLTVH